MSRYNHVEPIPERGNMSIIDGASWRALIVEGCGIPKGNIWRAVLGLCIWQYSGGDKKSIADELELDEMLRKEMFLAIERQERFNRSAQTRQLKTVYGGFRTSLVQKIRKDGFDIPIPKFEDWVNIGTPTVKAYIENVLNDEC